MAEHSGQGIDTIMSISAEPGGCFQNCAANPAATPSPSPRDGMIFWTCPRLTISSILFLVLFLIIPGLRTSFARAEGPQPAVEDLNPAGPLDFDSCVRLALRQSPFFIKSSVEIDIRRLDEDDSRYRIFPTFTFRTYYYVNRPHDLGLSSRSYTLQFASDGYNPIESYFTLQAQKMITQIAVYTHLTVISEGLERLGKFFLELSALKRLAAYQADLIELTRQKLIFAQNRLSIGTGTSLEVKVAEQELALAQAEQDSLTAARHKALEKLSSFLGLKQGRRVIPDLREVRRQVMGEFDPVGATMEQARAYSYELKIQEMKKELQKYRITLAKFRLLPNLLMNAQTADPLSVTTARGIYVGLGLEMPIWDGLKRYRNISRQKAILKHVGAETEEKEIGLSGKWLEAREEWRSAATALKLAQAQEELARLKERQSEVRYQSGSEPLPVYLDGQKAILEARKNSTIKNLEQEKAILGLRHLTGELDKNYVGKISW